MSAAYATKEDVIALAPELQAFDGTKLALIVDTITAAMLDAELWGDLLSEGHQTLAAHWATITLNPSKAAGPVVARAIDKISESYAAGNFADAELGLTEYGRMHLALLAALPTQTPQSAGTEPIDWALPDGRIH